MKGRYLKMKNIEKKDETLAQESEKINFWDKVEVFCTRHEKTITVGSSVLGVIAGVAIGSGLGEKVSTKLFGKKETNAVVETIEEVAK